MAPVLLVLKFQLIYLAFAANEYRSIVANLIRDIRVNACDYPRNRLDFECRGR